MAWSDPLLSRQPYVARTNPHSSPQTTRALKIADLLSPVEPVESRDRIPPPPYVNTHDLSSHIRLANEPSAYPKATQRSESRRGEPTRQDWENFIQREESERDRSQKEAVIVAPRHRKSHSLTSPSEYGSSQATSEQYAATDCESRMSPFIPVASPAPTGPTQYKYTLSFRQQPKAARACGRGERDRRVIDPPPILELKTTDAVHGTPTSDMSALFAMHCSLIDAETGKAPVDDYDPRGLDSSMMGASAASPFQGKDEFGRAGTFFVFPDLSCRSTGRFKLNFQLLRIDLMNMQPGARHLMVASIDSEVFTSYTAKDFPGMQASTALLIKLREQGLNVGIKKGSNVRMSKRRARSSSADSRSSVDAEGTAKDMAAPGPMTKAVQLKKTRAIGRRQKKRRVEEASIISF